MPGAISKPNNIKLPTTKANSFIPKLPSMPKAEPNIPIFSQGMLSVPKFGVQRVNPDFNIIDFLSENIGAKAQLRIPSLKDHKPLVDSMLSDFSENYERDMISQFSETKATANSELNNDNSQFIVISICMPSHVQAHLLDSTLPFDDTVLITYYGQKPMTIMDADNDFNPEKVPHHLIVTPHYEDQYLLFHKTAALKTIERNKEFIIQRLELDKNTTSKEILDILTSKNSILNPRTATSTYHDLTGIMLGYPKYSSIIFQLKELSGIRSVLAQNENIDNLKIQLKEKLYAQDSIYSSFRDDFKKEIAGVIDSIEKIKIVHYGDFYQFVQYVNEPEEIQRINSSVLRLKEIMEKVQASPQRADDDNIVLPME